jgi:hypothetical protein
LSLNYLSNKYIILIHKKLKIIIPLMIIQIKIY